MNAGRKSLIVLGIVAAFCGSTVRPGATQQQQASARQVTAETCGAMTSLTIPQVVINSASMVAAGAFQPEGARAPMAELPAFCRVAAVARPTDDSTINFEVWIPAGSAWN